MHLFVMSAEFIFTIFFIGNWICHAHWVICSLLPSNNVILSFSSSASLLSGVFFHRYIKGKISTYFSSLIKPDIAKYSLFIRLFSYCICELSSVYVPGKLLDHTMKVSIGPHSPNVCKKGILLAYNRLACIVDYAILSRGI